MLPRFGILWGMVPLSGGFHRRKGEYYGAFDRRTFQRFACSVGGQVPDVTPGETCPCTRRISFHVQRISYALAGETTYAVISNILLLFDTGHQSST